MIRDIEIDKTGWKKVRFGDVCCLINHSSRNPKVEGFQHVVGLEHIEPYNLHIRSCGNTEDETTFTRIFRNGQVLFGRRRAYQRKVAYAEFDGICSGDIMVFEAIQEKLLPRLLPFIVQSDGFFNCAVDTSAGSLSPRTKFVDLAKYEFLLPPKEEQARLAELLWAVDDVVERNLEVRDKLEIALSRKRINLLGYCINGQYLKNTSDFIKISKILLREKVNVGKVDTTEYLSEGKFPIIDQSSSEIAGYSNKKEFLYSGQLPVIIFGDHTTNVKYVDYPFILGADGTKVLLTQDIIDSKYLYFCIKNLSLLTQGYRRHFSILQDCSIPFYPIEEQHKIVKILNTYEEQIKGIERYISQSQQLKSALINQIF